MAPFTTWLLFFPHLDTSRGPRSSMMLFVPPDTTTPLSPRPRKSDLQFTTRLRLENGPLSAGA